MSKMRIQHARTYHIHRFTEIWVPPLTNEGDVLAILRERFEVETLRPFGPLLVSGVVYVHTI